MQAQDGIVRQLRRAGFVEGLEAHPVEARQPLEGTHPQEAVGRLRETGGGALRQAVLRLPVRHEEILLATNRRERGSQGRGMDQTGVDEQEQRQQTGVVRN